MMRSPEPGENVDDAKGCLRSRLAFAAARVGSRERSDLPSLAMMLALASSAAVSCAVLPRISLINGNQPSRLILSPTSARTAYSRWLTAHDRARFECPVQTKVAGIQKLGLIRNGFWRKGLPPIHHTCGHPLIKKPSEDQHAKIAQRESH